MVRKRNKYHKIFGKGGGGGGGVNVQTYSLHIQTQRRSKGEEWKGVYRVCCACLCSRVTHLLHPGSTRVSVVPDAWGCVCWRERSSLLVKTRAQLILRLTVWCFRNKNWQNG